MLTLADVTKTFGRREAAVDAVSLSLLAGERMCLLGHNGAGKTTLMRMAVGMSRPTSGSVLLLGEDPVEVAAVRRQVGYLSDVPYVYGKLTCREHLRLHASLYGLTDELTVERGAALLRDLRMEPALDQRAETFSLGMNKKLALTLALAHEPGLLVLDEPLNGLDPESAGDMEEVLLRRATHGAAILLSTHSVEFADRFATRFGTMGGGRLLSDVPRCSMPVRLVRDSPASVSSTIDNSLEEGS